MTNQTFPSLVNEMYKTRNNTIMTIVSFDASTNIYTANYTNREGKRKKRYYYEHNLKPVKTNADFDLMVRLSGKDKRRG